MSWDNESTNKKFRHTIEQDQDEYSEYWDYDADQQLVFDDLGTHISLDCEVDLDTGMVRCWGFEGVPLTDPVLLTREVKDA